MVFTSFNGSGLNGATGVALQSNGDIVVVGGSAQVGSSVQIPIGNEFAVARYTSSGALDTTFGTGGEVLTQFGSSTYSGATGVAIQSDGSIVVVGSSSQPFIPRTEFAVARYTSSGALDTSFGTGGEILTQFGSSPDTEANSVAIQANGDIVVAGISHQTSIDGYEFAVARYTSAGALDTSFGTGGEILTPFGSSHDTEAKSVAIQADGAIVVAGYSNLGNFAAPFTGFAVARYTSAGALDTTFGFGGLVFTQFGSSTDSVANSLAIQVDGAIVVAGYSNQVGVGREFALARYQRRSAGQHLRHRRRGPHPVRILGRQ
jgi:uncharacterized delta-60 repeat protein